ncbi:MAG: HD domain-containing protein [Thermodesulfovibrionales bacterium]
MHRQVLNKHLYKWLDGLDGLPKLYIVGGTVRDLLLDKVPVDIDLACRGAKGLAERVAALHNAAVVAMEKKPHQPCYRVVDRKDSADYLDIAELRGDTIDEDLRQRDFTINAMAIQINKDNSCGATIDPLEGAGDLRRKSLRMTNPQAFDDDPLRVLRAFRFAADSGFTIEATTLAAVDSSSVLLGQESVERIMSELFLIFRTAQSSCAVAALDSHGILDVIFPEIIPMKGCLQNGYHHKDVWGHSLLALKYIEHILYHLDDYFGDTAGAVKQNLEAGDRLSLIKCAALFHDVGKPVTKGLEPATGRITFREHDRVGAEVVDLVAERMKLSVQARTFLFLLVREHLQPLFLSASAVTPSARMRWFRKLGDDVVPALVLAMADVMSSQGPESGQGYRDNFVRWCGQMVSDYYASVKKILDRPRLISGHDLIELGMKPGPEIGCILHQVSEAQDTGEVANRDEALALAGKLIR